MYLIGTDVRDSSEVNQIVLNLLIDEESFDFQDVVQWITKYMK